MFQKSWQIDQECSFANNVLNLWNLMSVWQKLRQCSFNVDTNIGVTFESLSSQSFFVRFSQHYANVASMSLQCFSAAFVIWCSRSIVVLPDVLYCSKCCLCQVSSTLQPWPQTRAFPPAGAPCTLMWLLSFILKDQGPLWGMIMISHCVCTDCRHQ